MSISFGGSLFCPHDFHHHFIVSWISQCVNSPLFSYLWKQEVPTWEGSLDGLLADSSDFNTQTRSESCVHIQEGLQRWTSAVPQSDSTVLDATKTSVFVLPAFCKHYLRGDSFHNAYLYHIFISQHCNVHFKYFTILFHNCTSIKQKFKKES